MGLPLLNWAFGMVTAKHSTVHRATPHERELSIPKHGFEETKVEKPWSSWESKNTLGDWTKVSWGARNSNWRSLNPEALILLKTKPQFWQD